MERIALKADDVAHAAGKIARDIVALARKSGETDGLVLVAIRRGGVHLAARLRAQLAKELGRELPAGTLDIALYRDDLAARGVAPVVGTTEIGFPLDGKTVVLVDDVLFTGRTVRAALDELVDFGRPRRVWLAVLVDRGGRELPITADFIGACVDAGPSDDVQVRLKEDGSPDDVVVVKPRRGT
ncbi:MAG: bifunctional pyr operon transcriptional regulator/uracil phosphoribosyltransferase PyrR [Anaeromyxobacteraceae bacterium]